MMASKKANNQQKRYIVIICILILVIGIVGYFFLKKDSLPSSNVPMMAESYSGEFPCADCSGIMTTLTLTKSSENNSNGSFVLNQLYEGKESTPLITKGTWNITQDTQTNPQSFILTLAGDHASGNTYYLITGASTLTMLNSKKEKIDSPFNESLKAVSINSTQQSLQTNITNHLSSWLPTVTWSKPAITPQQTFYGDSIGYEITGTTTTKEAFMPHFENQQYLQSLGFILDNNISADGPGGSEWGYIKQTNGKKQILLFSYRTLPTSSAPNQPLQFNCPCKTDLTVYLSNPFKQ